MSIVYRIYRFFRNLYRRFYYDTQCSPEIYIKFDDWRHKDRMLACPFCEQHGNKHEENCYLPRRVSKDLRRL